MHYEISYKGLPREEADQKAIEDIREYVGDKFNDLVEIGQLCESEGQIRALSIGMCFAGIQGYPFHAFARKYCPTAYRKWMTTGPDVVELDDQNFPIKRETVTE